jgi:hypothetical protein
LDSKRPVIDFGRVFTAAYNRPDENGCHFANNDVRGSKIPFVLLDI